MTRRLLAITLAAASLYAMPAAARTDVDIILNFGPPPVRYEPVPVVRPGMVWVAGYWDYRYHRHAWVPGHYVRARPGYVYRNAHWAHDHGRYSLVRPGWEPAPRYGRRGDTDRDGVPNAYDRHPYDPSRG